MSAPPSPQQRGRQGGPGPCCGPGPAAAAASKASGGHGRTLAGPGPCAKSRQPQKNNIDATPQGQMQASSRVARRRDSFCGSLARPWPAPRVSPVTGEGAAIKPCHSLYPFRFKSGLLQTQETLLAACFNYALKQIKERETVWNTGS